ncbi:Uncharacterized conserved protein, DUF58 family, contains vWF domain [Lentibacillus halodurans]|uniref:Uncharacterized conserved protein, DUF58 family, contains vWF domain n=1 Tax=Lentibacillus halodurans TaxID=237679 RepID=A0A1I0YNA4_9BACI|nr:DUF58 domain-containing protein [Lentibacillus halodurans]SFB14387.1 Uncharacterized conserved protein, DUF58 family, contains vWF domain [Lentibacillus halodurans]
MNGTLRFAGKLSLVIALLLLLLSYAMFQGGFVSWFLFFGALPIFLYHLGLLFYPIKNWRVTRSLSRHVTRAGDHVQVNLLIKRSIPFPLYYCICEEIFPDSLQKVDDSHERYRYLAQPGKLHIARKIKKIVFPGFRRVIELPYFIEQLPRGEHQLQAVRIRTGDVFGIITKEHIFHVEDQIAVFPNERPVQLGENMNSYEQGSVSSQSINLKNTNVATGIREYTPGDKFSWIDWKQTARKNTVITKEFEQEKSTDTVVVLDACYHQGINDLAFETGIELTMSLLGSIQKRTSQAGFLSIGGNTVYLPLHHDPAKKDWIKQHLTRIQPGGTIRTSVKLREEMMQITPGANIILVTTHLENEFQNAVRQIRQRNKKFIIIFIQASELISKHELNMIRQLRADGIVINVLTENELARKIIEVSIV